MDSRRLVVWISSAVLGFQGVTLGFDLLNCTVLSWVYVQRYGVLSPKAAGRSGEVALPASPAIGRRGEASPEAPAASLSAPQPVEKVAPSLEVPTPSPAAEQPFDPMALFCQRPQNRIDAAVGQGLTILAGLALGGSLGAAGKEKP
jgi:hypothetical protein